MLSENEIKGSYEIKLDENHSSLSPNTNSWNLITAKVTSYFQHSSSISGAPHIFLVIESNKNYILFTFENEMSFFMAIILYRVSL